MFDGASRLLHNSSGLARSLAASSCVALAIPIASLSAATTSPIPDQLPAPVHSRQNVFSIPFQYDGRSGTGPATTSVQLQVSENHGRRWLEYARIDPSQGRFTFRARRDGEYWFSVRTLDSRGPLPPQPTTPELIVIVDTAPPRVELAASRGSAGEISAQWQIVEPPSRRFQRAT